MKDGTTVLIVGAGPTGLTAALEFQRMKVPYRIIDRYTEPPSTSRALAVQSRTLELMHQRGLAGRMVDRGNKGYVTSIYSDGRLLGRVDLRNVQSRFNYTLLLAQSETENIFRGAISESGGRLECGTELIAFGTAENDGHLNAVLRRDDGQLEAIRAQFLIAADGAHSMVRHTLGSGFNGSSLPHSYALADLHVEGDLPEDQLTIFAPVTGLLAAFPMGNSRFRVIATEKGDIASNAPEPNIGYMHHLWSVGSHIPVRFFDMVWSSRFRINSRHVDALRHQRIFLAGDAAHIHSPAGGQGMNTGIQDAINLAWKIAAVHHGYAEEKLLDSYQEERMPIIRRLVNTTEKATDLLNSDNAALHTLLTYALPMALSLPAIGREGASVISEEGANYRHSSLHRSAVHSGSLKSGDRFPDVRLRGEGDDRSLDVLDPSCFSVLVCSDRGGREVAQMLEANPLFKTVRVGERSEAIRALIGDADLAVVRPDGYLFSSGRFGEVAVSLENLLRTSLCFK